MNKKPEVESVVISMSDFDLKGGARAGISNNAFDYAARNHAVVAAAAESSSFSAAAAASSGYKSSSSASSSSASRYTQHLQFSHFIPPL
jgi:hypothetical protein